MIGLRDSGKRLTRDGIRIHSNEANEVILLVLFFSA